MQTVSILVLAIPGLLVIGASVFLFTRKGNKMEDVLRKLESVDNSKTLADFRLELENHKVSVSTSNPHVAILVLGVITTLALPSMYIFSGDRASTGSYVLLTAKVDTSALLDKHKYNIESSYLAFKDSEFTIPIFDNSPNTRFQLQSSEDFVPIAFGVRINRENNNLILTDPASRRKDYPIDGNSVFLDDADQYFKLIPKPVVVAPENSESVRKSNDVNLF